MATATVPNLPSAREVERNQDAECYERTRQAVRKAKRSTELSRALRREVRDALTY